MGLIPGMYMWVNIGKSMDVVQYISMKTYIYTYICIYMCVCIYIHTYIYVYI